MRARFFSQFRLKRNLAFRPPACRAVPTATQGHASPGRKETASANRLPPLSSNTKPPTYQTRAARTLRLREETVGIVTLVCRAEGTPCWSDRNVNHAVAVNRAGESGCAVLLEGPACARARCSCTGSPTQTADVLNLVSAGVHLPDQRPCTSTRETHACGSSRAGLCAAGRFPSTPPPHSEVRHAQGPGRAPPAIAAGPRRAI